MHAPPPRLFFSCPLTPFCLGAILKARRIIYVVVDDEECKETIPWYSDEGHLEYYTEVSLPRSLCQYSSLHSLFLF